MKLIARLFALSLVATGAVASTQIHAVNNTPSGAKMGYWPTPGCDPNAAGSCGMSGQ